MIKRALAIATLLLPALAAGCGGGADDHTTGGTTGGGGAPCENGGIPPSCQAACTGTPRIVVDGSTFVSPEAGPVGVENPPIAVLGTELYYAVNLTNGGLTTASLMSVSLGGGDPKVLTTSQAAIGPIVATSTGIVFSQGSEVLRVPLGGGMPEVLATADGALDAWTTDGSDVYFSDDSGTKSVPLAGGTPQTISTLVANGDLVAAGGSLDLYDASQTLWSVPLKGGSPVQLASGQANLTLLTSCGGDVCWIDFDGFENPGVLQRLAPGGQPTALSTSRLLTEAIGMVFDGTDFFTTAGGGVGVVARVPGAGGDPVALASGGGGLAVDSACVYWSDFFGIHSVAKSYTPANPPQLTPASGMP